MTSHGRALALVAAGFGCVASPTFFASPTLAQSLLQAAPQASTSMQSPWGQIAPPEPDPAEDAADPAATAAADPMQEIDASQIDWSLLSADASTLSDRPDAKTRSGKPAPGNT